MNVNGTPIGNTVEEVSDIESSQEHSSSEESTANRDVPTVQPSINSISSAIVSTPSNENRVKQKRKRNCQQRPDFPQTNITVDAARELIKSTRKRHKSNRSTEPVLAISGGKLSRVVQYPDERGRLYEYGHNLNAHEFELASYVLESKWLPGQPKKGSTYGGKSFEFPSLFFGIDEKATNVLKSLAVLLGTNEEPKKSTMYSGSHYAYILIGSAVCPDAPLYYKDAIKAFGGDMMIRTLIKEVYSTNERICAIVDCTYAQAQSVSKDADKLLDMITQGYKPKTGGFKYATKPDFYDSDD